MNVFNLLRQFAAKHGFFVTGRTVMAIDENNDLFPVAILDLTGKLHVKTDPGFKVIEPSELMDFYPNA